MGKPMITMDEFRSTHKIFAKKGTSISYNGKVYKIVGNNGKQLKIKDDKNEISYIDPNANYEIIKKVYKLTISQLSDFAKNVDEGWSLRKCLANSNINFNHQLKYEKDNPEFVAILAVYYKRNKRNHPNAKRIEKSL